MIIYLVLMFILCLIGIRIQKFSNGQNTYVNKSNTTSILGIFALLIFLATFLNFVPETVLSNLDKPAKTFITSLGQLIVVPFLFYSGFGVYEQFKLKGEGYANQIPKRRILKVYLMFLLGWLLYAVLAIYKKAAYGVDDYLLSLFFIKNIGNNNWYIAVILLLYFVSFISLRFAKNNKLFLSIHFALCLFLFFGFKNANLDPYWYNTLFAYFFGVLFAFFRNKFEAFFSSRTKCLIGFLVSIGIFVCFYYLFPHYLSCPLNILYYFLAVLFFCFALLFLTRLISIQNKILEFFGKHSFWLFFLSSVSIIGFQNTPVSSNRYAYLVVCFVCTVVLAFIFKKVFDFFWSLAFDKKGEASEKTNIRVGVLISYVALLVSLIGALIVTPKVLSELGDAQYGLFSFSNSITAWLTVISSALAASYLRFATREEKSGNINKTNTLYFKMFAILSVAIAIIISLTALILYFGNIRLPQYTDDQNKLIIILLFISGIQIAITILFSVFNHYNVYKKQFIFVRGLALIISIINLSLNLILAIQTKSVIPIAISATVTSLLSSLILMFYAKKKEHMKMDKASLKKESPLLKEIIVFSSFILLNTIVDQINQNVDKTILGFMVNAEAVTKYTLSKYFNAFLLTMSIAISGSFAPKIHELVNSGKKDELNALFIRVSKIQMIVIFLVVGGFIGCGSYFIPLWLGEGYSDIYAYSCVLLALDVIPLTVNFAIEVQRAMNKHKFRALLYICVAFINVLISILLVYFLPKEQAVWGVIIGTVFSIVVGNCIILNIYNKKVIELPIGTYFLNILKFTLISGIGIGAAIVCSHFLPQSITKVSRFIISGSIFLVLYVGILCLLERKMVLAILRKIKNKSSQKDHLDSIK